MAYEDDALFDGFFVQHPEWQDDTERNEAALILPLPGWIAFFEWVQTCPYATHDQRVRFDGRTLAEFQAILDLYGGAADDD